MLPVKDEDAIQAVLHEVVETLAPLERRPCSPGEREAAEWLAARLSAVDGVSVSVEDEPSWGTFPPTSTGLGMLGTLGAAAALRGRRALGGILGPGVGRGARRRGPERAAGAAPPGPSQASHRQRRRPHGRPGGDRHARRDRPPRRAADRARLRPDAAQRGMGKESGADRAGETLAAAVVDGLVAPLGALLSALTGRRGPAGAGLAVGALRRRR